MKMKTTYEQDPFGKQKLTKPEEKSAFTKGPQQGKVLTLKVKDSAFKNLHLKK